MVKVSGPVSIGIFSLYNKKVFLFGDIHTNQKGLCRKCIKSNNCLFITDFIDGLENGDVFIESSWLDDDNKQLMKNAPPSSESVLDIVRTKYNDYLYGFKVEPNKRFHYADIRDHRTFWPLRKLILYLEHGVYDKFNINDMKLIQLFADVAVLQKFADVVVKSDDYVKSIKVLFNATIAETFLSNPFNSNKQIAKVHRIRKQILKLPKIHQQKLLQFHKDRCRELIKKYEQIDKSNFILVILDGILPILTHLMDMYLLSRVLYYIKKKDSKNIVTYTGKTHTEHYITFFTKYMKDYIEMLYHEDNANSKRVKRCVSLPTM